MKLWLYLIIALALFGAIGTAKHLYDKNQTLKSELVLEKAKKDEAIREGNRYANRPRSRDDITNRLCAWAAYVERQNQDSAKRKQPLRACP